MFAPYNDMGSYPVPDLVALGKTYGWKSATAAFIQADASGNPAWANMPALNQKTCNPPSWNTCSTQAEWIYTNITNYIASGGNLIISLGGASGTSLAQYLYAEVVKKTITTSDAITKLTAQYIAIIEAFPGLVGLDFDIEGGAQNDGSISLIPPALRGVKNAYPTLPISFTLPVLPTGLTDTALPIVQAVVDEATSSEQVLVNVYNLMAMDYGTGNWSGTMGELSTQALSATYTQINSIYTKAGRSFSYQNLGCTPMIGVNDVSPEIFTIADMDTVLTFASQNKLGLLAFWDGQRDNIDPSASGETTWKPVNNANSGTNNPTGAYSQVFDNYLQSPVECCVQLSGVTLPGKVSLLIGGKEYAFGPNSQTICNNLYPGNYTITPPVIRNSNSLYTAKPLTISVEKADSPSSPNIISYIATQGGNLCLTISSAPFTGVLPAQFPTLTVDSFNYAFTALDTPVCNVIPVGSYTITVPSITIGTTVYSANSLPVVVPNNSSSCAPIEIVYAPNSVPSTGTCSVNVTSGATPWGNPGAYKNSITFSINYTGADTIETPWNFVAFNSAYVSSTVWGSASACTPIPGGLQYKGDVSIASNQTITIGGTIEATSSTGFTPTSATLNGMSCTIN